MSIADYGMGRRYKEDPKDRAFPMRRALEAMEPEFPLALPDFKYWVTGPILNQGSTSKCVAYTCRQWINSTPLADFKEKRGPKVDVLYDRALEVDEFPGNEPEYGTTTRAGLKVLQEYNLLAEYVWSYQAEEVAEFILRKGTVAFGTNWYRNMFRPDKNGVISEIPPRTPNDGGHAYLCTGYSKKSGLFRFTNSWGLGWGRRGNFYMPGELVQRLLNERGEAAAGLEIPLVKPTW